MTTFAVVPVRIEAMFNPHRRMVTAPLADYSRLPWSDGNSDYNFSTPFLGDSVIHHPFQNQSQLLEAGVHLHFIVPHFLGRQAPAGLSLINSGAMPAAPNRWLVTKTQGDEVTQWIVESDYVHAETEVGPGGSCLIPFGDLTGNGRPYRFMGRTTLLGDPRPAGSTFGSLGGKPLTVIGCGDPNFSSFYPNCKGVFGFHDAEGAPGPTLSYSVLGWHSDGADDLLSNAVANVMSGSPNATIDDLNGALRTFSLKIALNGNQLPVGSPVRTLYYGNMAVDGISATSTPDTGALRISVGSTGTEALSALMAKELSEGDTSVLPGSKRRIEEQIEAMLLHPKLAHLAVDVGPKFVEARHEKGFHAKPSGHLWRILTVDSTGKTNGSDDPPRLPDALAGLLHTLNLTQYEFDAATREMRSLREQLYFDWFRYMQAAYPQLGDRGKFPDPERVRFFIENHAVGELERMIASTGTVTYGAEQDGFSPAAESVGANDLANALVSAWNALNSAVSTENTSRSSAGHPLLRPSLIPASRFWKPNPPAVMIAGLPLDTSDDDDDAPAGTRVLPVILIESPQSLTPSGISGTSAGDVLPTCAAFNPPSLPDGGDPSEDPHFFLASFNAIASRKLSEKVWNPFILEWKVTLRDSDILGGDGNFEANGIHDNFVLAAFSPELKRSSTYTPGDYSVFSGSVLLSTGVRRALFLHLRTFVRVALKQYSASDDDAASFLGAASWKDAVAVLTKVGSTVSAHMGETFDSNPLYTAYRSYQRLLADKVLVQTLDGFEDACIMRRKAAQLPIAEPLGFGEAKRFTAGIREHVGNARDTSPITAYDFNPIRSGAMTLDLLRLIDDFGVPTDIDIRETPLVAAEPLLDADGELFLRPRLAQPARLNFRWLSALPLTRADDGMDDVADTGETNDHVASSPVCGWLVANYLDESLAVFGPDGSPLGEIAADGAWTLPPWATDVVNLDLNVANEYARQVVRWLSENPDRLADFLRVTQVGLDNVAPAHSGNYTSTAILMGRPLAIVRAKVGFQLHGLPALDLGWGAFLKDMRVAGDGDLLTYEKRSNRNWAGVKLPFRLGEFHQLNDGLIGYWAEDSEGTIGETLIAPETDTTSVTADADYRTFDGTNFPSHWLPLGTPDTGGAPGRNPAAMTVTMLVDPRGVVHATSGVLPTKAISIPPKYYLPAFKRIGMWFRTTPLLQPNATLGANVNLRLPTVEGYEWGWWDTFGGSIPVAGEAAGHAAGGKNTLVEGWLTLKPTSSTGSS